jgi:hypothetical protein
MLKANGVTAKPASKDGFNSDEKSPNKTSPKRKSNGDAKPKRAAAKKVKAEPSSPARSETPVKDETKDEDDQTVISGKCFHLQPLVALHYHSSHVLRSLSLHTFPEVSSKSLERQANFSFGCADSPEHDGDEI